MSDTSSVEDAQNVNNNNIDKTKEEEEEDAQDENDGTKGYGLNVRRIKNMFSTDPSEPKRPVLAARPWSAYMSRSSVVMESASPNGRHRSTGGEAVSPCSSERKFVGTKKVFESSTTTPATLPSPVPKERATPLPPSEGKDVTDRSSASGSWRLSPGLRSASPKTEFAMPVAQIRKSSEIESEGDDPARERRKSDKPVPIFGHQVNAGPMSKRLEKFLQDDDDDDDDDDEAEDVFDTQEKDKTSKTEFGQSRDKGPVESKISPVLQSRSSSSPSIAQKPAIPPRGAVTAPSASRPAKVITSPSAASTSPVGGSASPTEAKTSPAAATTSPTAVLSSVSAVRKTPKPILTSSASAATWSTEEEPRSGHSPVSPSSREAFKRARQFNLECPRPFRPQHDSQGVRWSRIEVPLSPTAVDAGGDFASGFPASGASATVSSAPKAPDAKAASPQSEAFETELASPKRKISETKTAAWSEIKIAKTDAGLPECDLPEADTASAQTKASETRVTFSQKKIPEKEVALLESQVVSEIDIHHSATEVSDVRASIVDKYPDVEAYAVTEVDAKVESVHKTSPGASGSVFEQLHFVSTEAKTNAGPKQQAMEDSDLKSAYVSDKALARSTYFEITNDNLVKNDDKQEPFKTSVHFSQEVDTATRSKLDEKMHAQKEVIGGVEKDYTSMFDAPSQLSSVSDTHATTVIESKMHVEREVLDDSDDDEEEEEYMMSVEEQVEPSQVEKPRQVDLQKQNKVIIDADTKLEPGVEGHQAAQELQGNLEPHLAVTLSHSTETSIRVQEIPPVAGEWRQDAALPVVEHARKPSLVPADLDAFPVELEKGPKGLGIGILGRGPDPEKQDIHVAALLDGGAAKVDGRISVGDRVLEVDGVSLVGVSEAVAGTLLKNTSGRVGLLVGRRKSAPTKPQSPLAKEALHKEPEIEKETEQKPATKVSEQQAVPEHSAEPKVRSPGIITVESDETKAGFLNLRQPASVREAPSAEPARRRSDGREISVPQVARSFQPEEGDREEIVGKPSALQQEAPEERDANERIAGDAANETRVALEPELAICPAAAGHRRSPPKTTTVYTSQIPPSFGEPSFEAGVLNAARAEFVPRPIPGEDLSRLGDAEHAARWEALQEAAEQEVPARDDDDDSDLEHWTKPSQASSLRPAGDKEKEVDEDEDIASELDELSSPEGEAAVAAASREEPRGRDAGQEDSDDDWSDAEGHSSTAKLHFTKVSVAEQPSLAPHAETRGPGDGGPRWGSRGSLGSEEDESGEERALMELAEDRGVVEQRLAEALAASSPPYGSRDHRAEPLLTECVGGTGSPDAPAQHGAQHEAQHGAQSAPLLRDLALGTVVHDLPPPRTLELDPLSSAESESVTDARDILSKTLQHKGLAGDQAPEPSPCGSDDEPEPVVAEPPAGDEDDERKSAGEAEASDGDAQKAGGPRVPVAVAAGREEKESDAKADDEQDAEEDQEARSQDEGGRETVDEEEAEKPRGPSEDGDEEPAEPLAGPDHGDETVKGDTGDKGDKAAADEAEEGDAEIDDERRGSGDGDVPETPDAGNDEPQDGLDFSAVVPLTERLDTSAHKARAQLLVKAKRQKPSRGKLRKTDSEVAEEELESTPSSPATPTVGPGAAETPSPGQAAETPVEAAKSASLASPVSPASDARTGDEDKDAGFSSPGEGTDDTPTSKSRLKLFDIGASLRRSGRGRKSDKDQRASTLPRDGGETDGSVPVGPDMASSSCMPFLFARKGSFSSTSSAEPGSVNASPEKRRARGSEEALQSPAKQQQWPSGAVPEWTPEQVSQWLKLLGLEQHAEAFTTQGVDGKQLLQLDSTKLKALGVTNLAERSGIKKRLKEMRTVMEKERKLQEKMERQREKLRKKEEEQLRKSQRASKVGEESPAPQ